MEWPDSPPPAFLACEKLIQQFAQLYAEPFCEPLNYVDRWVAPCPFQIANIGAMDIGLVRKLFLRPVSHLPQVAQVAGKTIVNIHAVYLGEMSTLGLQTISDTFDLTSFRFRAPLSSMSDINPEAPAGEAEKKNSVGGTIFVSLFVIVAVFGYFHEPKPKDDSPSDRTPTKTDKMIVRVKAEDRVRQTLRDPGSAEFSQVQVYVPDDGGPMVTCGYVNSRNGFGGMSAPKPFIAGATVILEEQVGAQTIRSLWAEFCQ